MLPYVCRVKEDGVNNTLPSHHFYCTMYTDTTHFRTFLGVVGLLPYVISKMVASSFALCCIIMEKQQINYMYFVMALSARGLLY